MTDPAGPSTAPPPPPTRPPSPRRSPAGPLRLTLLAALVAATVLAVIYNRSTRRRATLSHAQQLCLDYERPPGLLVYDEDPVRAADLIARSGNPEYVAVSTGGAAGEALVAGHVPEAWRAMLRWAMPAAAADRAQHAVLFLHERQTADGRRGLVCVQADRAAGRLVATFVYPGARTLDPVVIADVLVVPAPRQGLVFLSPGPDPFAAKLPPRDGGDSAAAARADLRLFAGQPDPIDPTHLTIRYAHGPRHGEIDLWVQDERTLHYEDHTIAAPTP